MNIVREAKTHLFDWIAKGMLGIITFLAIGIYNKVDKLSEAVPVMQQQIKSLEEGNSRLNNKVFASAFYNAIALKPKAFSITEILLREKQPH